MLCILQSDHLMANQFSDDHSIGNDLNIFCYPFSGKEMSQGLHLAIKISAKTEPFLNLYKIDFTWRKAYRPWLQV